MNSNLKLCAVTGTNGKTTVTHILRDILSGEGYRCALVGTLGVNFTGEYIETGYTTPPHEIFSEIVQKARELDYDFLITEASSHALDQERLAGFEFDIGIFTNFSHDHLDYHKTPDACAKAKSKLFRVCDHSVINYDDPRSAEMAWEAKDRVWYYSIGDPFADFYAENIERSAQGISFDLCTGGAPERIRSSLYGDFSVYNMLAASSAASILGVNRKAISKVIGDFRGVEGRMQRINPGDDFAVIVDFAHTPDAMKNVLTAAREFTAGRLICVFGCGGGRDREKRPEMGAVAEKLADTAIITEDNSRDEMTSDIIGEIMQGIKNAGNVRVIADRRDAIRAATDFAQPGDTVMILGKGHEKYIHRGGEKIPFSDAEEIKRILKERRKN